MALKPAKRALQLDSVATQQVELSHGGFLQLVEESPEKQETSNQPDKDKN